MPIENTSAATVITGKSIFLAQVLTTRSALSLETKGIRVRRNYSAYAVIKKMFGFRGNRLQVLDQLNDLIERTRTDDPDEHARRLEEYCAHRCLST